LYSQDSKNSHCTSQRLWILRIRCFPLVLRHISIENFFFIRYFKQQIWFETMYIIKSNRCLVEKYWNYNQKWKNCYQWRDIVTIHKKHWKNIFYLLRGLAKKKSVEEALIRKSFCNRFDAKPHLRYESHYIWSNPVIVGFIPSFASRYVIIWPLTLSLFPLLLSKLLFLASSLQKTEMNREKP
jgi:hypothetical protein